MAFDFAQIPVPFRMQPGLARLADDACHLTALSPTHPLHAEKLRVLQAGQSRHVVPGFDPAPALAAIARQAAAQGQTHAIARSRTRGRADEQARGRHLVEVQQQQR